MITNSIPSTIAMTANNSIWSFMMLSGGISQSVNHLKMNSLY